VIFGTAGDYAADVPATIYGLDANTGKVLWTTQPQPNDPLSAIYGSATLVGNDVAIGVASNDEAAGLPGFPPGSPQPPPTSRGSLVLLDPHNGHIIWQTYTISDADYAKGATGAAIWSTPAYDPALGLIYAGTGNNYSSPTTNTSDAMIAFNAKTGAIVWVNQRTPNDDWDFHFNSTAPDADFGNSPHIYTLPDGETVVGSGQKSGFYWVFDAKTGAVVNIQPNGKQGLQVVPGGVLGGLHETAAVDPKADMVFAPGNHPISTQSVFGTGDLTAISGNGLNVLWQFATPSPDILGVAVANGVVYTEDLGGTFYALDENTGKVLAQLYVGGGNSGPSISGGQIFIGQGTFFGPGGTSRPGGIVALGLSKPQANAYVQTNLVSDGSVPAEITDLWTLTFGNGGLGGDPNTLYFSAGINSEKDGLFGEIQPLPLPPPAPPPHPPTPTPPPHLPTPTPHSPLAQLAEGIFKAFDQRIDATFHAFNAALASLESQLTATNPQLFGLFQTFNTELDALEASFLNRVDTQEAFVLSILDQL
jgi:glucose dehydrogenase